MSFHIARKERQKTKYVSQERKQLIGKIWGFTQQKPVQKPGELCAKHMFKVQILEEWNIMNCNLDSNTADQKDDFNGTTDSKTTTAA